MADAQERLAALREAAALKAQAREAKYARVRAMLARGYTFAEVARATGTSYTVLKAAVGAEELR